MVAGGRDDDDGCGPAGQPWELIALYGRSGNNNIN